MHIVLIGDDDAGSIHHLLADADGATSLTCVEDIWAALTHLREQGSDVVVLHATSTYADELEAVALLREQFPHAAIIALVDENTDVFAERARIEKRYGRVRVQGLRTELLAVELRHFVARAVLAKSMREREEELHALFDLNPHPMWVYEAVSLKFLAVNQVAIHSYGYSEEEFLAMQITDLRLDTEAGRLRQHIAGGLPAHDSTGIWTHRTRRGDIIEVEIVAQALPPWGANARLVQARDVTAERRAMRAVEASERRFRNLFEHSTGFTCIHDLDGLLLSINPAAATALGRSVSELLGTDLRNLYPPQMRKSFDDYLARIVRAGEDVGSISVIGRDGTQLVWQYRNRLYADDDGNSYVMGYAQDITALRAAEDAFRATERRLRTIADTLPLEIVYIDANERFVFVNEAYRKTLAAGEVDVIGRTVHEVVDAQRYAFRHPYIERALRGERVQFEIEEGDGDHYRCREATFIPELAEDGADVVGIHAMLQDVTAKKREEKRLIHLARVDALTGLMNRVGFHARLNNAIARARDQGSLLAVLYLDIDRFKQVNDIHGHAIGDALIRAFAERINSKIRVSDTVARIGGDEFTILIEDVRDARYVRQIVEKLVVALRRPFELQDRMLTFSVGTSIGVGLWQGEGAMTADLLIARADAMLYEAKQAGRDTYRMTLVDPAPEITGASEQDG